MRADPPRDGPPAGGSVLVTLADRSYLDQAKQLFASAYHDAGWRGDYLLLAHDLSGSETAWFADRGILVHHCRPLFTADVGGHPGVLASKLYLFTPDFRRWRTVIYCDADATIRASLDRLTSVRGFWSVDDVSGWLDVQVIPPRAGRRMDRRLYRQVVGDLRRRYDLHSPPFCAGFFAFSTDLINDYTFPSLSATLERYQEVSRYGDQLALNLFFYRQWRRLSPVYNIQVEPAWNRWRLPPSELEGIVVHYISPEKPWITRNHFYPEWRANLERADRIDLATVPNGFQWSDRQIRDYSAYLDSRDVIGRVRSLMAPVERRFGRFAGRAVRLLALSAMKVLPAADSPPRWLDAPCAQELGGDHECATHYLLCATPRSGSTLLCLLLWRTGTAGMRPVPGFGWEPLLDFRLGPAASYDWDELDVRAYFERTLRRTCSPNGIGAFKLMWDQVSDFAHGIRRSMRWRDQTSLDFARLLPEGTRYLWLVRRDTLRQAVSLSRAIQTGCWDSRAQREFTGLQLFDHRHVRALLKWVEHQNREWERFFRDNGINPLRLTYEEVVDDPPSAVVEIFRFLGIPAPPANEMRSEHLPLERQTDAVTEEWIRRFERVESSKSLARAWHMAWGYPRRLAGKALGTLRERRRRRRQFGITRHQRRAGRRALARG